jgi:hypothetical protein
MKNLSQNDFKFFHWENVGFDKLELISFFIFLLKSLWRMISVCTNPKWGAMVSVSWNCAMPHGFCLRRWAQCGFFTCNLQSVFSVPSKLQLRCILSNNLICYSYIKSNHFIYFPSYRLTDPEYKDSNQQPVW